MLAVGVAGGTGRASPADGRAPMLGADLIYGSRCGMYIVADYGRPGVRPQVLLSLHAMRAAGLESLGLFLWWTHDPTWEIPSAAGRLTEPYRTNLIRLLSDIRDLGFRQVTATFQPLRSNDMKSWTGVYDPARFDENWSLIRDVRSLVKEYGPASARFDLLGEGAPSDWDRAHNPVWWNDLIRMYRNYVEAFGHEDVTISAMAKGMENWGTTDDDVERMQNLVDLLRASGKPLPTWFAVSATYDARVLDDLRAVDATLRRNGLSQPLVIGEEVYNKPSVADAVAAYVRGSERPLLELDEWPLDGPEFFRGEPVVPPPRCPALPYAIDAYAKALRDSPPSRTLRARVEGGGRLTFVTPYGQQVKALLVGRYTVVVRDASAKHSFHLYERSGRGSVDRSSGIRFRGTRTWNVDLGYPGGVVTYAAQGPGGTHGHFTVLVPG